jgi:hypothetical protein
MGALSRLGVRAGGSNSLLCSCAIPTEEKNKREDEGMNRSKYVASTLFSSSYLSCVSVAAKKESRI